jgi:hypothetical protein
LVRKREEIANFLGTAASLWRCESINLQIGWELYAGPPHRIDISNDRSMGVPATATAFWSGFSLARVPTTFVMMPAPIPRAVRLDGPPHGGITVINQMSLPREILDQLLSGYLDDALSADEHARVERLLETDPDVALELEELRGIRFALRDVAVADSTFRLPAGFADRVLDAAVATARSEGLSEDHPLIRLAEQPSPRRSTVSSRGSHDRPASSWRGAAVLVALAASIVFAVVALRPDVNPVNQDNPGVAMTDPGASSDPTQPTPPDSIVAQTGDPNHSSEVVTQSPPAGDDTSVTTQAIAVVDATPKRADVSETVQPDRVQPSIDAFPVNAIATNDTPSIGTPSVGKAGPEMVSSTTRQSEQRTQLGAILVVDIEQTDLGRQADAVKAAMQAVGIGAASQKSVTEDVVAIVGDVDPSAADADAAIMYLQVSAKRLDRLVMALVADEQNIQAVRFLLAEDAPILGVASSLQPVDPMEIQHAGVWQLAADSQQWVGAVAHDLAGRPDYLPIDRTTAQAGAASMMTQPKSGGPDVMSQILLLIR